MMTVNELLARAKSVTGKGIKYRLGAGGMNPVSTTPANISNECDCSGYVCWALGISRQTTHPLYVDFNGGWINTDAMCMDGSRASGLFEPLEFAEIGSLIVYPGGKKGVGHVGIVTQIVKGIAIKVVHCSAGNWRKYADAIVDTGVDVFNRPDTRFLRYCGIG